MRGHYVAKAAATVAAGQATGDAIWDLGLAAEAGLRVTPHHIPIVVELSYRLERFDFPGGAAAGRLEQFDAIWVRAGVNVGSRR